MKIAYADCPAGISGDRFLEAFLSMLNSCAAGIGIENSDNGFGAEYLARNINHKES